MSWTANKAVSVRTSSDGRTSISVESLMADARVQETIRRVAAKSVHKTSGEAGSKKKQ